MFAPDRTKGPIMTIPDTGFVIHIKRERNEKRAVGNGYRYRTVGSYSCYMDGKKVAAPNLSGATVEPRGPGNNGQTGVNRGLRIEAGTYPLGTHGFPGAKYHTFGYRKNQKPRPGVYVHDTDVRTAILIHMGRGFKASVGCINLTGEITGPDDNIGPNTSFRHMDAFIEFMKRELAGFPSQPGRRIANAWLVIDGEP